MVKSEESVSTCLISFQFMEEKQWVRYVREKNDRSAFELIYRKYYKSLNGYAYSYLKHAQDAEDVVQTVFLKIWANRESWDPPGTVKQYLFAAVRNEALNVLRHEQVIDKAEEEITHIVKQQLSPTPSATDPEAEELRKAIQKGIDQLPPKCRQIFMLNRRNGLTYSEIAEDLDVSVNTVATQMGRALKSLRKQLSNFMVLFAFMGFPSIICDLFITITTLH